MNAPTVIPAPSSRPAHSRLLWILLQAGAVMAAGLVVSCSSVSQREVLVSVKDQKIALMDQGQPVRVYDCSTSKFGVGDAQRSYATPLGRLRIAQKIGAGAPAGQVFKARRPTREILPPDAPGRDPIVTRIMWLSGTQSQNSAAYGRCIYIHGTPEERYIGRPASYGCVRMRSGDIMDLFNLVDVGTDVRITDGGMPGKVLAVAKAQPRPQPVAPMTAPTFGPPRGPQVVATGTYGPGTMP